MRAFFYYGTIPFDLLNIFAPCLIRPRVDALAEEQSRRQTNSANLVVQILIERHADIFEVRLKEDDQFNSPDSASQQHQPQITESAVFRQMQLQQKKDTPQLNKWKYLIFLSCFCGGILIFLPKIY